MKLKESLDLISKYKDNGINQQVVATVEVLKVLYEIRDKIK